MKKLVCALALSLWLWPACSTEQRAASQEENQRLAEARQEKQMYQDKVEAQLRELDREIDALRAKMGKSLNRKQLDQQMDELERKRAIAHQELDKLKNSSQEAWQDMKAGIDSAVQDLETAYQQAASHFK